MEYIREISLNIEPTGTIPVVRIKQGDASVRFLKATLLCGDEPFVPDTGAKAVFREEKPDGTGVMLDSSLQDAELGRYLVVINNDGTITVELVEQTTTCAGRCRCDICLIKDEQIVSTDGFVLEVYPSPLTDNLAQSSSDFRTIANALELIEDYINN